MVYFIIWDFERRSYSYQDSYTYGDSDVVSSFLSMPTVLAAMMWGKEM